MELTNITFYVGHPIVPGARNIQHAVKYTALAAERFQGTDNAVVPQHGPTYAACDCLVVRPG
jgi:hypothetical protein